MVTRSAYWGSRSPYCPLRSWLPNGSLRSSQFGLLPGCGNKSPLRSRYPDKSHHQTPHSLPEVLAEFQREVSMPDDSIKLLKAALLIAKQRHPDLDESWCVQQLDDMAVRVEKDLGGTFYPMRVVRTISKVMYQDLGFRGNSADYYNPDNSCMNKVLEERKGIPLSLALVFMEVGSRLGQPLVGVNLPAHFMIKPAAEDVEVLVDPFNGDLCFLQDAEERLSEVMGIRVQIDPRFVRENPPPTPRAFLQRMLNNLKHSYLKIKDFQQAWETNRYLRILVPSSKSDLRDEGLLLYKLERFTESKEALEKYLLSDPEEDAELQAVQMLLQQIKELGA